MKSASTTSSPPFLSPPALPASPPFGGGVPAPGFAPAAPCAACAFAYISCATGSIAFMRASCFALTSAIGAGGCLARTSFSSFSAASTGAFLSAAILSPESFSVFSTWKASPSALLRSSTSAWRFSSSAAWASASLRIFSISSFERPPAAVIVIFCSFWVPRSFAETFRMPFASMSNVTSICGTPRGAGGMPSRLKLPSALLSRAILRSPWKIAIVTAGWLSAAVEKTWLFFVGIVVLRSMSGVSTPPSVSMPSVSGVTSRRSTSFTSPFRMPPWIAAPIATTSSGLTPLCGSLPKRLFAFSWMSGMRVWPPTSTTSSTDVRSASAMHLRHGSLVRFTRSIVSVSSFCFVSVAVRCFGPVASAVMNGRLMSYWPALDRAHFAFSASSFRRWSAIMSLPRSMPCCALKSSIIHFMIAWSRSSPPRCVSPFVAFTSKTPSPMSRIEMSKVPPPKS